MSFKLNMSLFEVPEGRHLFLWTEAKKRLETARLFMTDEEMDSIAIARELYNEKVEELFDLAVEHGWKPNTNDGVGQRIEDEAALFTEDSVKGYKEAIEKFHGLFG